MMTDEQARNYLHGALNAQANAIKREAMEGSRCGECHMSPWVMPESSDPVELFDYTPHLSDCAADERVRQVAEMHKLVDEVAAMPWPKEVSDD